MPAQADRLGTVSDNIANVSTDGYKRASTEFSSFVLNSGVSQYQSGSVQSNTRFAVDEQGGFDYTASATDLAVKGEGFFIVSGPGGQPVLTGAGSFVKDSDGNLVNAAGYKLMGYAQGPSANAGVVNGFAGLSDVNIGTLALQASPSTAGNLFVSLPSNAPAAESISRAISPILPGAASAVAAGGLPPANPASGAAPDGKTSFDVYNSAGKRITLDAYFTKTAKWNAAAIPPRPGSGS